MDKTKEYLALAQKHHFWVICVVVLLASLTCWWLAESRLDKEFKDQVTAIDGQLTSMKGIAGTADHPNDKVTQQLRDKVFGIGNNVFDAWTLRFKEQQKVPQWQGDLTKPFLDWVVKNPPDAEIKANWREDYRYFIRKEIDKLFKQVDARELVEIPNSTIVPAPGGVRPPGRPNVNNPGNAAAMIGVTHEWKGLVAWDEQQREALRQQYRWKSRPTTVQVRYANEDLWIYRALLAIISTTNEGAKEHLVASIKQINSLNIGPLVVPPAQFFAPAAVVPGAGGGEGTGEGQMTAEGGVLAPPPAPGQGQSGQSEGGDASATALTQDQYEDALVKHGRYVDAKGNPVGWNQPEPFGEFKIMPFEMRLLMDQRKIPELLANCANSPLPVEVRQVGITSMESPPASAGGGDSGRGNPRAMPQPRSSRMPGGEGEMGGRSMPTRQPPRPRSGEGGGVAAGGTDLGNVVELRPFDLHVELRGVIYIFNEPDRKKVGKTPPPPEQPVTPPAEAGAGG